MSSHNPISGMVETAIDKIKEVMGSETAIGKSVDLGGGVAAIPVFKITFGFGSGGTDLAKRPDAFGGGLAGGVKVTPVAFLVSSKDGVKLLQMDTVGSTADNIVRTVPELVDKVVSLFKKDEGPIE